MIQLATLNESRESSAGAYANSLKCPVERSLNVELGKRAVQHCERLGLIQFPEKSTRKTERMRETLAMTQDDKRKTAKEAAERVTNGEKLGIVCGELGFYPCTVKKWCKKFGYQMPRSRKPKTKTN